MNSKGLEKKFDDMGERKCGRDCGSYERRFKKLYVVSISYVKNRVRSSAHEFKTS